MIAVNISKRRRTFLEIQSQYIFQLFAPYAFEPGLVYTLLVVMMLLSAVGLPLPEEVTLISVGILAYMGANPDLYPPPYPGAPYVHPTTAAIVAFLAVFCSDFLIYWIGRLYGPKLLGWPPVKKVITEERMERVQSWTKKYGALACGIFRFTPGIRFPGHLACGMLKYPAWKFAAIDSIAAGISVPTQIFLIAHYGEHILSTLQKFKLVVFSLIGLVILYFLYKKLHEYFLAKKSSQS